MTCSCVYWPWRREVAGTARERRKASLASSVIRHHGPDPWGCLGALSIHQILACLQGCPEPPAGALLCLRLCFPLASRSLSPPVHHVSLRGVAPVSESAVRCSVYLNGSPWSAPSHSSPPHMATHTGMYMCPALPSPSVTSCPHLSCNHHKLLVQIGCCFKCENNCSKAIKPE